MKTKTSYSVIRPENYQTTNWSGGTTTEIYIAPTGSLYGDRTFDFRISSATVDVEESTFTPLPDYDRIIMSLSGPLSLQHDGGPVNELSAFMPHSFDGASDTISVGKVTDFNLMLRKGKCSGFVLPFRMQENEEVSLMAALFNLPAVSSYDELFLYAFKGNIDIPLAQEETIRLSQGETLHIVGDISSEAVHCLAKSGVAAILAGVRYERS
ncbi:MAG: HutD family protein [Lachnospiraceae bacterium]|nr:HutD family protein [Lachnospiraceae bacterium]